MRQPHEAGVVVIKHQPLSVACYMGSCWTYQIVHRRVRWPVLLRIHIYALFQDRWKISDHRVRLLDLSREPLIPPPFLSWDICQKAEFFQSDASSLGGVGFLMHRVVGKL